MTPDNNDNEKERQLLYQSLAKANGFHLYLVQCNHPGLREEILVYLKERLASDGITLYYRHLEKPVVSLNDFLPPGVRFREGEKSVLAVSGLENSFSTVGEPQDFLHRLNFSRDVMPKRFPVPFVLWLPVGAFKKILTEAHDVWSWRSGTFYFSTPPEMLQSQPVEMDTLIKKAGGRVLSEKTYKERLLLFTGLLEDLKHQTETQKNQLQRADLMAQIAELHYSFSDNVSLVDQRTAYLEKALEFHLKTLHIREKVFERNHPELANSYNNLAVIYMDLKDYESAAVYCEKAVAILQLLFPDGHPDLDMAIRNLERIREAMG